MNINGQVIAAAGNMTNDGSGHTYTYDAENRLVSTAGWTYTYDGDGRRVKKCNACTSASGGTLYWPGTDSDPLIETDLAGNLNFEYIFFNGKRVARRTGTSVHPFYYLADHLGSTSVLTGDTGTIQDESDYFPYGGEIVIANSLPQNYKFTGKERDSESGLDNFGARYMGSNLGRFMSPDLIAGQVSNPQSLNLYSYVRNNPVIFTDPTGMIVEWRDSKVHCNKGDTVCKTNAQRAYEARLKQMRESKGEKTREKGEQLTLNYERLQQSKAVFEVINDRSSGPNGGEITYQGNDHFTINLHGNDNYGLTDNQRLAHEFEHGRQVLDGEVSFQLRNGAWLPFAHDLTDEAKGFQAGFAIEGASPGQGAIINEISRQLNAGGVPSAAQYLGQHIQGYRNLPTQLNVPNPPPPNVYVVPQ